MSAIRGGRGGSKGLLSESAIRKAQKGNTTLHDNGTSSRQIRKQQITQKNSSVRRSAPADMLSLATPVSFFPNLADSGKIPSQCNTTVESSTLINDNTTSAIASRGLSEKDEFNNARAPLGKHAEESLISLDDGDPVSVDYTTEEKNSTNMQDMWTLGENENAVVNMIVEVTMEGMSKEKDEKTTLVKKSLANGVIPEGRGIGSSVYSTPKRRSVTKESINKYWETQGPSFRKGLQNDSIRLILDDVAAEIVRRDGPSSSCNLNLVNNQTSANTRCVSEGAQFQPDDEALEEPTQVDSLDARICDPCRDSDPMVNSGDKVNEEPKMEECTLVKYDVPELLKLRDSALTLKKSAFPEEVRTFVVKDADWLSQKPENFTTNGEVPNSKWASLPKTLQKSASPSSATRAGSVDFTISESFSDQTILSKKPRGLGDSKWATALRTTEANIPGFKALMEGTSDVLLNSIVTSRPRTSAFDDFRWTDKPSNKESLTRPSINKQAVDRVINPQLNASSGRERRKNSIHTITEATKRRSAALQAAAAKKEIKHDTPPISNPTATTSCNEAELISTSSGTINEGDTDDRNMVISILKTIGEVTVPAVKPEVLNLKIGDVQVKTEQLPVVKIMPIKAEDDYSDMALIKIGTDNTDMLPIKVEDVGTGLLSNETKVLKVENENVDTILHNVVLTKDEGDDNKVVSPKAQISKIAEVQSVSTKDTNFLKHDSKKGLNSSRFASDTITSFSAPAEQSSSTIAETVSKANRRLNASSTTFKSNASTTRSPISGAFNSTAVEYNTSHLLNNASPVPPTSYFPHVYSSPVVSPLTFSGASAAYPSTPHPASPAVRYVPILPFAVPSDETSATLWVKVAINDPMKIRPIKTAEGVLAGTPREDLLCPGTIVAMVVIPNDMHPGSMQRIQAVLVSPPYDEAGKRYYTELFPGWSNTTDFFGLQSVHVARQENFPPNNIGSVANAYDGVDHVNHL